jgi:hypothetical protein
MTRGGCEHVAWRRDVATSVPGIKSVLCHNVIQRPGEVLVEWAVAQIVHGKTLRRSWKFFLDRVQPTIRGAINPAYEDEKEEK